MNSSEAIDEIKSRIMQKIVTCDDIVDAIDSDVEDLIYENVFPFVRIPTSETEKKTYISIQVDIDATRGRNGIVYKVFPTIYVVTHQDLQIGDSGVIKRKVRLDFISSKIEQLFNKSEEIGLGETKLLTNFEDSAPGDFFHPCRIIRFESNWLVKGCG